VHKADARGTEQHLDHGGFRGGDDKGRVNTALLQFFRRLEAPQGRNMPIQGHFIGLKQGGSQGPHPAPFPPYRNALTRQFVELGQGAAAPVKDPEGLVINAAQGFQGRVLRPGRRGDAPLDQGHFRGIVVIEQVLEIFLRARRGADLQGNALLGQDFGVLLSKGVIGPVLRPSGHHHPARGRRFDEMEGHQKA